VGRESDGRFVASIPDLADLAAYGSNEKDAVANVTDLAAEHVRSLVERYQSVPRPRPASEMPTLSKPKKIGRAMILFRSGGQLPRRRSSLLFDRPANSTIQTIYLVTILNPFLAADVLCSAPRAGSLRSPSPKRSAANGSGSTFSALLSAASTSSLRPS